MITKDTLNFLEKLSNNNNKEWFIANKNIYENELKNVNIFFKSVYEKLQKIDNLENIKIFRIYKDVRFSKDKTPYKTNFGAAFIRKKPELRGGLYIHIENKKSFVGGGFWEPNAQDLFRIRKEFEIDASEIKSIINNKEFKKYFGTLQGDEVKTAPKGFNKLHPNIDLIRKKQFLISKSFDNEEVTSLNFADNVIDTFIKMYPFFNYMTEVLTTDLNGISILNKQ